MSNPGPYGPYKRFNKRKTFIMPPRETDPAKMALAARDDLPPEVTSCFITIEKLLAMRGKGGIMTSRWAPRPDEAIEAKISKLPTTSVVCLDSPAANPSASDPTPALSFIVIHTTPVATVNKLCGSISPPPQAEFAPVTPSFLVTQTFPVATVTKMFEKVNNINEEKKVQSPISPVHTSCPTADSRMPANNKTCTPQGGPKKPAQLASSWEEFTSWAAITERSRYFSAGSYGCPIANVTHTTPVKPLTIPEPETKTLAMPQDVATAKIQEGLPSGDRHGVDRKAGSDIGLITQVENVLEAPVPKFTPIQEHLSLLPRPRVEEVDFEIGRDLFMKNMADAAPVSESGRSALDQAVSDDGVEAMDGELNNPTIDSNRKWQEQADSRNYLAPEVRVEQGTTGPTPAPYSFLIEGDPFTFVPTYVLKWAESLPEVMGKVDMQCDQFKTGVGPIINLRFGEAIEHPTCYPDVANSSNMHKQQSQTAEIDAKFHQLKKVKRQRHQERRRWIDRFEPGVGPSAQFALPARNPWAPSTAIYIRAAQEKDVPGITAMFNYYVSKSIIPEDQTPVTEKQMHRVLAICRAEMLPFIVAIKDSPPSDSQTKDPEMVLGFGFTDDNVSSIGQSHLGRSRFTAQIEFYVHHEHLRQGIGRCILDRLLSVIGPNHAAHDGCPFICMPGEEKVYGPQPGGGRRFHQVFLHRPVQKKNDPDIAWFTLWLKRFYMFEAGRLISAGRSSKVGGLPRFLDVVIFQFEATLEGEYDIDN